MKTCATCGNEFEPFTVRNTFLAGLIQNCPDCSEKHIAAEAKLEFTARSSSRNVIEAIVPPLYQDTDPSLLPSEQLKNVLAWAYGAKGMVLVGPSGKGKSRCAYLLLTRLAKEGRSITVFDTMDFELECQEKFIHGEQRDWIKRLTYEDIVYFDDLGKCKLTDRVESTLFGLFEKRIANKKPVLCSTNDTGATLEGRMTENRGAPLVRRLKEFCTPVVFP